MVRGGPVGVAVKRRLRERGFDAGQAFGERLFGSGCCQWPSVGDSAVTGTKLTFAATASATRECAANVKVISLDVHGRPRFAKLPAHCCTEEEIAPVHSDF